jgi:serine/threonine protein kinase
MNAITGGEYIGNSFPAEISERFHVTELLAQTAFGETLRLTEKSSNADYVLKRVKKPLTPGTRSEAHILGNLSHAGLPRYESELESSGERFILRRYVPGIPLDDYMQDNPARASLAVSILIQLCGILTYLHNRPRPVIHRDIKPSNIIIDPDNGYKITLIDFGAAREYSKDAAEDTVFLGTPPYAPPEQYGFKQTDPQSDIYPLGVLLRWMTTGYTEAYEIIKDKGLERIAAKCCAFAPEDRYRSAAALEKALEGYKKRMLARSRAAAVLVPVILLVLTAGFFIGRYTDFFNIVISESSGDTAYAFAEPLVEAACRAVLGIDAGEPVTVSMLDDITELYFTGNEPTGDIDSHLRLRGSFFELNLPRGELTDLSDLPQIKNLRHLSIFYQRLSDISPLTKCLNLEVLEIIECAVRDLSPITGLTALSAVMLSNNQINDFSVFGNMPYLRILHVSGEPLSALSELGDITEVRTLSLNNTALAGLEGIENFRRLETLEIDNTPVKDFSPLNDLPFLTSLRITSDMEACLNTLKRDDLTVFIGEAR